MIEIFDDSCAVLPEKRNSVYQEHSVIIDFYYPYEELEPLFELEDHLYEILPDAESELYDGHEICINTNEATLFFYGSNAETLFKKIKPVLDKSVFLQGAIARLTFGPDPETSSSIDVVIGH